MEFFKPTPLSIQGVFTFNIPHFKDERGQFSKLFHAEHFNDPCFNDFQIKEVFYSFSTKGSVRGMHFQLPPHDHAKVVTCPKGAIQDVILDLRQDSPTFGQFESVLLDDKSGKAVYIPTGCAHGFQTMEEGAMTLYLVSSVHAPAADVGIHYDSFGMNWPLTVTQVSDRDQSFPTLKQFKSPF